VISLFYFLAACAIQFSQYTTFLNFVAFAIFCGMACISTDLHFKPCLGASVLGLVLLFFVPWFYGVLLWLVVSGLDAGIRGKIQ